jgi:hypothetical protein
VTCDLPIKKFGHTLMLSHVCELPVGGCAGTEVIARVCVFVRVSVCVGVCGWVWVRASVSVRF